MTGAEDKIMEQCATPEVAAQFKAAFDNYQELVESQGVSLLGTQPTEGNIRGGLSTIEEKALGQCRENGALYALSPSWNRPKSPRNPACTSWIRPAPPPKW